MSAEAAGFVIDISSLDENGRYCVRWCASDVPVISFVRFRLHRL